MYIYEIPYRIRQRLVDVLNVNDAWRDLAGTQLGYDQIELDKFRRAGFRQGESPADALLSCWGQKNHTVAELFKYLYRMKHFQAMDAIKDCVDPKYHKYIQYGCAGSGATPTMSMSMTATMGAAAASTIGGIPFPPKTYQRSSRDQNLLENFGETEKWEPKKFQSDARVSCGHSTGQTIRDAPTHPVDLISLDDNEVNGAAVLIPVPALGPPRPLEQQQVESQQVEPRQNDMRQVEPRQNDMRQAAPRQNERGVQNGMLLNIVSPTYQQGGTTDNALSPGVSGVPHSTKTGDPSTSSRLRQRINSGIPIPESDIMLRTVPFAELAQACNGFSQQNILGRGGFGEVYRGRWNGQDVAVKRIREDKRLRDDAGYQKYVNQAITELQALHTFPAENVLPLLAFHYVDTMETDPCLVYQYMSNGSVSDRLRCKDGTPPLKWSTRGNIALGTARGLCHLHANNVIHGDIKGPNILLDKHLEPKIGDFGLARGGPESDEYSYKIVSSVQGTASYLPDDYIRSRHLTAAVDTFCYGIFLFELVTGKPPSWQPPGAGMRMRDIMLDSSNPGEWIDKSPNEVTPWANCLFFLGRDCAKHSRKRRPEMKHVLFALEELQKSPSSLALQGYYDVKNSRGPDNHVQSSSIAPQDNFQTAHAHSRCQNIPAILESDEQQSTGYIGLENRASEEMPPQIHHADPRSENIPVFLENGSEAAAGHSFSNIPIFLNDDQSLTPTESVQIVSDDDVSSTSSGTRTLSASEIPNTDFIIDEPSLPMLSEHLRFLSLGRAATSRPIAQVQNHNRVPEAVPNDRAVPNVRAVPNDGGVPDLPDISLQVLDDPLADNRLFSAEMSAEQASSFGILE